MTRKMDHRKLLADIRAGMGSFELMEKYALSGLDLKRVLGQIAHEREARARAIAADLIGGVSDLEVMKTYKLSSAAFLRIMKTLLEEGYLTQDDLKNRNTLSCDVMILDLRKEPRHAPAGPVTLCDATDQGDCVEKLHVLQDISLHGLAVKGMEAQVQDTRRIILLGDDFGEVAPFEFEAVCRWTRKDSSDDQPVAGFEITHIAEKDSERLADFIKILGVSP